MGNIFSNAFKGISQALGFSKPKISDSAYPQLDPQKAQARQKYGQFALSDFDKYTAKNFSNPEYFNPSKAQYTYAVESNIPRPTTRNEGQYQLNSAPKYGEAESSYNWQPVRDLANYGSQFQNLASEAKNSSPMTLEGYDPEYEKLLLEQLTRYSGEKESEATKAANERLARSGISASTVGAKTIGDIQRGIANEVASAKADVGLRGLEAKREDRYRNQQINEQRRSAAAALLAQAMGADQEANALSQQAYQLARQGRMEDTRRAEVLANQKAQEAEFARQGRSVDEAQQSEDYDRTLRQREAIADENRRVQRYNLLSQQKAAERLQEARNDAIRNLMQYGTEGSANTPESELRAQKYQDEKALQEKRKGNFFNTLFSFL